MKFADGSLLCLLLQLMGNNRSKGTGGSREASSGKFLKKKSLKNGSKNNIEAATTTTKEFTKENTAKEATKEVTKQEASVLSDTVMMPPLTSSLRKNGPKTTQKKSVQLRNRRASLHQQGQQQGEEDGDTNSSTIGGSLKKCKSEKGRKMVFSFASNDHLLHSDDTNSVESPTCPHHQIPARMATTATQHQPSSHRHNAHFHHSSSSSASARLQHRQWAQRQIDRRRVKSFRHFPAGGVRFATVRPPTANCHVTGLSPLQKRLVLMRWQHAERGADETLAEAFQRMCQKDPEFARSILHLDCQQLAAQENREFRLYIKRFVHAFHLFFVSLEMGEPSSEFFIELGASLLSDGVTSPAHPNPSASSSRHWHSVYQALCELGGQKMNRNNGRGKNNKNTFALLQNNPLVDSVDHQDPLRAMDAWNSLCFYAVAKIRLGYEVEKFLRDSFTKVVENFNNESMSDNEEDEAEDDDDDGTEEDETEKEEEETTVLEEES